MSGFFHKGRVAFHETDAAGIVHFSNYFRYAEEAECAALATLGIFSADTLRLYSFPRVQASAQYNSSLRAFDAYTVRTHITRIGNSSLTWSFEISGKRKSCATLCITSVRVSAENGAPIPYFPAEKEQLKALMPEPANSAPCDKK